MHAEITCESMKQVLFIIVSLLVAVQLSAVETYAYAQKDSTTLYLDIHRPTPGSQTAIDSVQKPVILYLFGGGFKSGSRDQAYLMPWYQLLNDNGYTVVAIDYRLGMKGYKMGKGIIGIAKSVSRFCESQNMGVEDMFSAIRYLSEHAEIGVDVNNIVLSGSSAGAIICLATAQTLSNGVPEGLPEGFALRGVMSFAGAIISEHGAPKFKTTPCPILFFHGMNDNAVAYKHYGAFGKGMWGSSYYAAKLAKKGGNYCIYRFKDRAHDVAAYFNLLWSEEKDFLEKNVMKGDCRIIDALVDDPALPVWKEWGTVTPQEMYNGK